MRATRCGATACLRIPRRRTPHRAIPVDGLAHGRQAQSLYNRTALARRAAARQLVRNERARRVGLCSAHADTGTRVMDGAAAR